MIKIIKLSKSDLMFSLRGFLNLAGFLNVLEGLLSGILMLADIAILGLHGC